MFKSGRVVYKTMKNNFHLFFFHLQRTKIPPLVPFFRCTTLMKNKIFIWNSIEISYSEDIISNFKIIQNIWIPHTIPNFCLKWRNLIWYNESLNLIGQKITLNQSSWYMLYIYMHSQGHSIQILKLLGQKIDCIGHIHFLL